MSGLVKITIFSHINMYHIWYNMVNVCKCETTWIVVYAHYWTETSYDLHQLHGQKTPCVCHDQQIKQKNKSENKTLYT